MKVTLEFTLPDEEHELQLALDARDLHLAAYEFGEYLRSQYKYVEPDARDDLAEIRERWFQIMGDLLEDR